MITPSLPLTADGLVEKYGDYFIFKVFVKGFVNIGEPFLSPLRNERRPSACIFKSSKGNLLFSDLGTGYTCNAFTFALKELKRYYPNKSYNDYLNLLNEVLEKQSVNYVPPPVTIKSYKFTPLIKSEGIYVERFYKYWERLNVSKALLEKAPVKPIEGFVRISYENDIERYRKMFLFTDDEELYIPGQDVKYIQVPLGMVFFSNNQSKRIYMPYTEGNKHFKETEFNYFSIEGEHDTIVIAKSPKDVLTIVGNLEVPAICSRTEVSVLSQEILTRLKQTYKNVYLWLDNDVAGMNTRAKYEGVVDISFPAEADVKDPSDFVLKYGRYNLIKYFEHAKQSRGKSGEVS